MDTLDCPKKTRGGDIRILAVAIWFALIIPFNALAAVDPIKVQVTTHLGDKQVFKQGDSVSFLLTLNQDVYLHAIYQDASGNLTLIIPNGQLQVARYKAGRYISIPGDQDNFEFFVSPPFGEETLWVIASKQAWFLPSLAASEKLPNGMYKLRQNIEEIKSLLKNKSSNGEFNYSITRLSIHTEP